MDESLNGLFAAFSKFEGVEQSPSELVAMLGGRGIAVVACPSMPIEEIQETPSPTGPTAYNVVSDANPNLQWAPLLVEMFMARHHQEPSWYNIAPCFALWLWFINIVVVILLERFCHYDVQRIHKEWWWAVASPSPIDMTEICHWIDCSMGRICMCELCVCMCSFLVATVWW